jgi:hypothetical protein
MDRRAAIHRSPAAGDPPSSRAVSRRVVQGRRLSQAEAASRSGAHRPKASGTRYLDQSSGALHQRTWCGGKDPVAATAPFSSSSGLYWAASPTQRREKERRAPAAEPDERPEFHPSVLRNGSPTQVQLGSGQGGAHRSRSRGGTREPAYRRLSSELEPEPEPRVAKQLELEPEQATTPRRQQQQHEPSRQPAATELPRDSPSSSSRSRAATQRDMTERGGTLFVDDIAVRNMHRRDASAGYPLVRLIVNSLQSRETAPHRVVSTTSDSAAR